MLATICAKNNLFLDLMGWSAPGSHQDVVMIKGEEDFIHADFHDRH